MRFFVPSLPRDSEELLKYAADGGHLYKDCFSPRNNVSCSDFSSRIALWSGNVQMIKRGSTTSVSQVLSRVRTVPQEVSLEDKPQWTHLITPMCAKAAATVLKLRAELLTTALRRTQQ